MDLKVDRRKFLIAAGASAAAIPFSELRPVFLQFSKPLELNHELTNVKACVRHLRNCR